MMFLSNRKNTINDRTTSGRHGSACLKVVLYLRLKFSIKIVTALAQQYGRVFSGAADFFPERS
jgi:hypothetical protein